MSESFAIERFEQAAALLPQMHRNSALQIPDWQKATAEELRLRVGRPMTILLPEGEILAKGHLLPVTRKDLEQVCNSATEYSPYAFQESIREGFLTVQGGFRIGLCGCAIVRNGINTGLRDYSSAIIRISREQIGLADQVLDRVLSNGQFVSTLILASPGLGKTTLLRDLVRQLSNGSADCSAYRVALADERGEVAAMYHGEPQMDVGIHTDILDACPKAIAIPMLLRSANPQIIAVDEITVREDLQAMEQAANCGVKLLATIHAADRRELMEKPLFRRLMEMKVFRKTVTICRDGNRRAYLVEEL